MRRPTVLRIAVAFGLTVLLEPAFRELLAADEPASTVSDVSTDSISIQIGHWIDELGSDSFVRRDFAGRQLLRQGTPAIKALVSAAGGDDVVAAQAATTLLSQVALDDLSEGGTIAHRGLSRLAGEVQTRTPTCEEGLRQAVRAADRRIAGIIIALGGQIERDEMLTITGVVAHDQTFTDDHAILLTRLTQLKRLDLRETAVSDVAVEAIRDLTKLQELNLSDTSVTSDGLQRLSPLKSLTRLSIYRLPLTPEEQVTLQSLLSDCEIRR